MVSFGKISSREEHVATWMGRYVLFSFDDEKEIEKGGKKREATIQC